MMVGEGRQRGDENECRGRQEVAWGRARRERKEGRQKSQAQGKQEGLQQRDFSRRKCRSTPTTWAKCKRRKRLISSSTFDRWETSSGIFGPVSKPFSAAHPNRVPAYGLVANLKQHQIHLELKRRYPLAGYRAGYCCRIVCCERCTCCPDLTPPSKNESCRIVSSPDSGMIESCTAMAECLKSKIRHPQTPLRKNAEIEKTARAP